MGLRDQCTIVIYGQSLDKFRNRFLKNGEFSFYTGIPNAENMCEQTLYELIGLFTWYDDYYIDDMEKIIEIKIICDQVPINWMVNTMNMFDDLHISIATIDREEPKYTSLYIDCEEYYFQNNYEELKEEFYRDNIDDYDKLTEEEIANETYDFDCRIVMEEIQRELIDYLYEKADINNKVCDLIINKELDDTEQEKITDEYILEYYNEYLRSY